MQPTVQGQVTLLFIRAGVKNDRGYLILANGRKEFYTPIDAESVEQYEGFSDGDEITLNVEVTVGSDRVKVLED